jgi:hypothetical protein
MSAHALPVQQPTTNVINRLCQLIEVLNMVSLQKQRVLARTKSEALS